MSIQTDYQPLIQAVLTVAKHYRIEPSEERIRVQLDWAQEQQSSQILQIIAKQVGLNLKQTRWSAALLNPWRLPLIAIFADGQVGVLHQIHAEGLVSVQFSGDEGLSQNFPIAVLEKTISEIYLVRPEHNVADIRVDEYVKPYQASWFWSIVLADWKRYLDIILASLLANILALAAIVFSMNVYDRVIPSQSITTLWVLAAGVLIAAVFEFSLRVARILLSDVIGKRADLRLSDRVFGHALRIKNAQRPQSTGTFIAQIRELEGIRELITSTTIATIADLPFFLLFLFIFWIIGGNLVWVLLLIVPLIIVPALLVQKRLAVLAQQAMRENSIRNAILLESVQGIEDIKLLRAESRFQNQWNHINQISADVTMQQRKIIGVLNAWTQKIQGLAFAIVVLVGCFAVMEAEMTTGALVACSILSSRMLAPIAQIAGVLGRWQQAKIAKKSLDELMMRDVDQPERSKQVHRSALLGQYQLKNVKFSYDVEQDQPDLLIADLNIRPGEKIAILGRNGAGKSTLLQVLSGMQIAQHGTVYLDDIDMNLLDPADVRRDMGLLNQNAQLFFGTIRENLTLGAPLASDDDLHQALVITGALDFIKSRKEGLDYVLKEGGLGLSGGQRQALLLARLLVRQPNILLLDEPTTAFDEIAEKQLVQQLKLWLAHRTLIVSTHRLAILDLVDRIIIVSNGKIVKDGPRDQVLHQTTKAREENPS